MALRVLIEGRPGSGKTTVPARLADLLRERDVDVRGFVTHELREGRRRVGFEVETFDGRRETLAHVDLSGPTRVGKYGVDLQAFERVALPALRNPPKRSVVVIDELGKMELASEPSVKPPRDCSRADRTSSPPCTSSGTPSPMR